MRFHRLSTLLLLSGLAIVAAPHIACGGGAAEQLTADAGTPADGADASVGRADEDRPLIPASKVDLLLVVDDSASMGDKARVLAKSIGTLIRDVARVGDVHVGVITTSLGSMGGDVCSADNPAANTRARLQTRGPDGSAVPGAETGVLSYTGGDVEAFITSAANLVLGVGENGCGFEAQLESAYRFLVQPDPWASVTLAGQSAFTLDLDREVLAQRKAFLRSDSALVVVMLTDEDDSSADPLSVSGQGWAFMAKNFPGSQVFRTSAAQGTTAPRGTSVCQTDPASEECTSCGFAALCDPTEDACRRLKADPSCTTSGMPGKSGAGFDGYHGPTDDELNVRFHRMKERFGIDPQFPLRRYVEGFTKSVVPSRANEHSASGPLGIGPYEGTPNCTNPIFAANLPSLPGDELCDLERGTRSRELVVFAVIGGVPGSLATDAPDWKKILGEDPDAFDFRGIDPHMIQSTAPRPGLPPPSDTPGDNGTDPIHGREWDTLKGDLQYACTFALPTPRTCDGAAPYCDCRPEDVIRPPLCGATPGEQLRAKAYPTIRPLRVVRELGDRGVVGSICSDDYDATMSLLAARLASRLAK
ncbi:MAG: hypothetical protein KF764_00715 [Labilithrix sp.]|nr:hypothetical protein [Labilithrix sp.]